jgi:hypothetical protein
VFEKLATSDVHAGLSLRGFRQSPDKNRLRQFDGL